MFIERKSAGFDQGGVYKVRQRGSLEPLPELEVNTNAGLNYSGEVSIIWRRRGTCASSL